jgi:hypothetical protein
MIGTKSSGISDELRDIYSILKKYIATVVELNFTTKEMISIFPLRTFHLYVATLQQHLHMEYISLSSSDIPELLVPIIIFFIEGCC